MNQARPISYFGMDNSQPKTITQDGITRKVWSITVSQRNFVAAESTLFSPNKRVNQAVIQLLKETYQHMLPGQRPCHLTVAVYQPLTYKQANKINSNTTTTNTRVGAAIGVTIGGAVGIVNPPAGSGVTALTGFAISTTLEKWCRDWHEGDLAIFIEGRVRGGIGQPYSGRSKVMLRSEYDPNPLVK